MSFEDILQHFLSSISHDLLMLIENFNILCAVEKQFFPNLAYLIPVFFLTYGKAYDGTGNFGVVTLL